MVMYLHPAFPLYRYKYLFYYSFCFLENTALVAAWFHARDDDVADDTEWYRLPGIVFHYVAFFAGLCFMLLYYGLFHPTGPVKVDLPRLFRRNKSGDGDGRSPPPHQGSVPVLSYHIHLLERDTYTVLPPFVVDVACVLL